MFGPNSIKIDVIVSWPRHVDYPLWRQQIHDNRDKFNNVIVVFTNMNVVKDYREFIETAMKDDGITFIESDPVNAGEDWRNVAVNCGLRKSDAKWVWFTEQDFFWKDNFWDEVTKHMDVVNVVSVLVEGRMHPCCMFVKRNTLDNCTRKDFSVTPNISDHFGKIQEDLHLQTKVYIAERLYTHLGGLSQNMFLMRDPRNPLYFPEEFKKYVGDCLKVTVPMHRDFEILFSNHLRAV